MKDMKPEKQEVWDAIPPRPPFLFVDKILNLHKDVIKVKILQVDEYFPRDIIRICPLCRVS
ncbi:MAG: hypothetical protein LBB19_03085 [Puniceicoccales bacterium]|jgi:3-hydroxymyristoyl/3-hydroxydecanoyl-(acyl carrier protein) dehydratase|nr:hypothetical protein [Puniceicoccales bacterium]